MRAAASPGRRTTLGNKWIESSISFRQLVDGDQLAWAQLDDRAKPVLISYMTRRGTRASVAEEIAQTAMAALARSMTSGSFRSERSAVAAFLFTVVRRELARAGAHDRAADIVSADHAGEYWGTRVADDETHKLWERTWVQRTRQYCLERLRSCSTPDEFQAFELRVRRRMSIAAIAECVDADEVQVSRMVYRVKCRLTAISEELRHDEDWLYGGALPAGQGSAEPDR